MVESQVRPSDVTDRRIIRAMSSLPREAFVPAALASTAYMDVDVPVEAAMPGAAGRYLLAPRVLAKLIQAAGIEASMTVLDVGCATGYSSAVMAALAKTVIALETSPALVAAAQKALAQAKVANVEVVQGPLEAGVAVRAPFDAIVLNGAIAVAPAALLEQLKDGGRLVGISADGYFGQACVWTKVGKTVDRRVVFDAGAHPLPGFQPAPAFVF
jgi:protein-L-isoaspartate(D-aspartate) O-methyltransferase